jgi:hypothetical protein
MENPRKKKGYDMLSDIIMLSDTGNLFSNNLILSDNLTSEGIMLLDNRLSDYMLCVFR